MRSSPGGSMVRQWPQPGMCRRQELIPGDPGRAFQATGRRSGRWPKPGRPLPMNRQSSPAPWHSTLPLHQLDRPSSSKSPSGETFSTARQPRERRPGRRSTNTCFCWATFLLPVAILATSAACLRRPSGTASTRSPDGLEFLRKNRRLEPKTGENRRCDESADSLPSQP